MAEELKSVSDLVQQFDRAETWRDVKGWDGYSVSSWGRVKGPRGVLTPSIVHGYEKISLSRNSLKKISTVHRLVALAFLGEAPFHGAIIAHNDGDRCNNRASNLRWASSKENQADRSRHKTRISGSRVFGAKLTESDIPTIRACIKSGERYGDIAMRYGVSISTVHLIAVNKTWKSSRGAQWN